MSNARLVLALALGLVALVLLVAAFALEQFRFGLYAMVPAAVSIRLSMGLGRASGSAIWLHRALDAVLGLVGIGVIVGFVVALQSGAAWFSGMAIPFVIFIGLVVAVAWFAWTRLRPEEKAQ